MANREIQWLVRMLSANRQRSWKRQMLNLISVAVSPCARVQICQKSQKIKECLRAAPASSVPGEGALCAEHGITRRALAH